MYMESGLRIEDLLISMYRKSISDDLIWTEIKYENQLKHSQVIIFFDTIDLSSVRDTT